MKRVLVGSIGCCVFFWATVSLAYEPGTHGLMSDAAAQNSALVLPVANTTTTVLQDLNLNDYIDQSFPDIQNGETVDLGPNGANPFMATTPLSIQNLIKAGAQLEDESDFLSGRPLNHFFDPVSDLALKYTFLGKSYQSHYDAPGWAANSHCAGSGSTGLYNPSGDEASDTNQCFSLQDAGNYFYNALTAPKAVDRDQQFGDLFLTLGHVMHLVQDMAQPQHVRNDPHCDIWECHLVGKHNPSRYEALTYDPVAGPNIGGFAGGYGPVSFPNPNARDFWSTGDGRGLAEYTNSNFFSAGSLGLYGGVGMRYDAPVASGPVSTETIQQVLSDLVRSSTPDIDSECPATTPCYVSFVPTKVHDAYKGTPDTVNPKAAAISLFSEDLKKKGDAEMFGLNDATYAASWKFLIPAAIDYSTGLVNYFFRGRLDVQYDPSTSGGYIVTNKSAYGINAPIEVYYDAVDGKRYKAYESSGNISLDPYCPGACNDSARISFQIPPGDPAPANPGEYMYVMNGIIGSEAGVAAKLFEPNRDLYVGQNIQFAGNFEYPPNQEPNFVAERKPDGTLVQNFGIVRGNLAAPFYLAVYNKTLYVTSGYDGYYGGGNVYASIRAYSYPSYSPASSQPITSGSTYISFGGGIAVNDNYIFVPVSVNSNVSGGAASYKIRVLDHAGNLVQDIPESASVGGLSANDKHICALVGGESALLDMQGQVVASLVPFPYNNYFDNMICGSTSDRHYVLSQYGDSSQVTHDTVYVFDDNGTPITSFTVDGTLHDGAGLQIAATATNVYISFINSSQYGSGVAVFSRVVTQNPDGSTAETYQRAADIGDGEWTSYGGVAVDMATVLNGPQ